MELDDSWALWASVAATLILGALLLPLVSYWRPDVWMFLIPLWGEFLAARPRWWDGRYWTDHRA